MFISKKTNLVQKHQQVMTSSLTFDTVSVA